MIDCQKVASQLFDYIDKELEPRAIAEMEKHMDLCRACFSVKEFEEMLRSRMKDKTSHACPDKVKQKIQDLINKF